MRENVSKGKRFDIFRRDGFRCQYCGKTPPEAILHVDHILAVKLGGTNSDDNLTTSCSECNLGKSAKKIDRLEAPVPTPDDIAKKAENLVAYRNQLLEKARAKEEMTECVCSFWMERSKAKINERCLIPERLKESVGRFLDKLNPQQLIEAIDIAYSKKGTGSKYDYQDYGLFKYFCGICWFKIKGITPADIYKEAESVR